MKNGEICGLGLDHELGAGGGRRPPDTDLNVVSCSIMVLNKRIANRIFTRFRVLYGSQAPTSEGFVLNLSADGIFVSGLRIFPPQTELKIRLLPIGADAIELDGKVRWGLRVPQGLLSVVRPGMGIHIKAPPTAYLDFFAKLIRMNAKRTDPRLEARLEVRFYHRELFLKEYTENISRGGLFIATEEPFVPGSEIKVDLVIPDLAIIWTITGQVAYCLDADRARQLETHAGIGIKITEIDPLAKETFRAYVQKIMQLYR